MPSYKDGGTPDPILQQQSRRGPLMQTWDVEHSQRRVRYSCSDCPTAAGTPGSGGGGGRFPEPLRENMFSSFPLGAASQVHRFYASTESAFDPIGAPQATPQCCNIMLPCAQLLTNKQCIMGNHSSRPQGKSRTEGCSYQIIAASNMNMQPLCVPSPPMCRRMRSSSRFRQIVCPVRCGASRALQPARVAKLRELLAGPEILKARQLPCQLPAATSAGVDCRAWLRKV